MLSEIKCDKCGEFMSDNSITRKNCLDCTLYYCSHCGYKYETGFRYNSLIKRHIKYVRFNK